MNKSVFGLDENIASALSYVLGPVSGFLVYVMEKNNKNVRFHALQSIVFIGLLWAVGLVINIIPVINWFSGVYGTAVFICTAFLSFMAFVGTKFKVPFIGSAVEGQIK